MIHSGIFEPLAHVPKDKKVVLGLVSSHKQEMESVEYLKRRIEEATAFIGLDQLALSPQCGFATGADMSDSAKVQMQGDKLAMIVDLSR